MSPVRDYSRMFMYKIQEKLVCYSYAHESVITSETHRVSYL